MQALTQGDLMSQQAALSQGGASPRQSGRGAFAYAASVLSLGISLRHAVSSSQEAEAVLQSI